ncbi:MAG: hypothetical protein DME65_00560 [Verrucomicrobia bacterium]|nr:MAG: hypothetical protein DME65_00560 [Verrucomicrobiota bacterium]
MCFLPARPYPLLGAWRRASGGTKALPLAPGRETLCWQRGLTQHYRLARDRDFPAVATAA